MDKKESIISMIEIMIKEGTISDDMNLKIRKYALLLRMSEKKKVELLYKLKRKQWDIQIIKAKQKGNI